MEKKNPEVDAYIENAASFARPILNHLRRVVHAANPNIQETIKWGMPHFEYKGVLCSMAAFKQHCAFRFWKASLLEDAHQLLENVGKSAMGHLGQIKSLADLPPDDILVEYIHEAIRFNEADRKVVREVAPEVKELHVPDFFQEALQQNPAALKTFQQFSKTNRKEYVEWLLDAKTEQTRNKRLETTLEWLAEGKPRNWKYMKK